MLHRCFTILIMAKGMLEDLVTVIQLRLLDLKGD
uniref:Uncharacterized protein n=1 Tax=Medicago truncatula TaxID=3880 RepID=I3S889_MEDTR|nr:unknown [Medicago truncatula]